MHTPHKTNRGKINYYSAFDSGEKMIIDLGQVVWAKEINSKATELKLDGEKDTLVIMTPYIEIEKLLME